MFSLENFYYILYTNLFKPARIDGYYFYPFGSVRPDGCHNFANEPDVDPYPKLCNILFYDQEPILENFVADLARTDIIAQKFKRLQILANSEHSHLKTHVCKKYNYADLYYFFHGIAANIWYRDYKYMNNDLPWKKVFLSLNHLVTKDRSYRLTFIAQLIKKDLLKYGDVSLHIKENTHILWINELNDDHTKLSKESKLLIEQTLPSLSGSLIVDTDQPVGSMSANTGPNELKLMQNSFFHIVTETVFYYDKLHLTEKIFKPIVSRRPFMLMAAPGNLAYLKSYGFKTFSQWIDESYDTEIDNDRRIEMIANEVERLCNLPESALREMHNEMKEVLDYNFNHFFGKFKQTVIHELLLNLETCIRVWNNGRVDGRTIDLSTINFPEVEKLLLS